MDSACKSSLSTVLNSAHFISFLIVNGTDVHGIDAFLANLIDRVPSSKYTLIYATSPREYEEQEMYNHDELRAQEAVHQDLRRDYAESTRQEETNDNRPLFEKYQFLSPGTSANLCLFLIILC
jgi:hypothetical protein